MAATVRKNKAHRLTVCRADSDYTLWLRFDDGLEGQVYLGNLVGVGLFKAWEDVENFKQVSIEEGVLCWEGGIDLDPEVLYQDLVSKAKQVLH
jgi:hypothetical protein